MKQYISKAEAADMFHVTKATIGSVIQEIQRNHIGSGRRYDAYAITGQGKTSLIRYAVLVDYMRYREWLNDPDTVNLVPAFDVQTLEYDLGVNANLTSVDINLEELAQHIVSGLAKRIGGST